MEEQNEVEIAARQSGKTSQTERDPLLPDRACIERDSRFHSPALPYLGVRVSGVERNDVVEYCVSGRWARIGQLDETGRAKPLRGYKMQADLRENVDVEPFWKAQPPRQVRRALARS